MVARAGCPWRGVAAQAPAPGIRSWHPLAPLRLRIYDQPPRLRVYNQPLRRNAAYRPPDTTTMSADETQKPTSELKPGYGTFCP